MIIEILLGVIVLFLALMGIGILSLRKRVSRQYNMGNIEESSRKLTENLGNLSKRLDQYTPEQLVEKIGWYKRLAEKLDRIVEKIYKPDFVKTLQNVEMLKQYTQAALTTIYKYMHERKEVLMGKLGNVLQGASGLSNETEPYKGMTGKDKVKAYKPLF